MSVPLSISQLSTTPALNGPAGTEPIGNNAALYLQAHSAFIAQLANGSGLTINQNLSMNGNQLTNLANGVALTDAVTVQQLKNYEPIGTIKLWSGSVANIASAWGANWALCNGQNGTPNLTDKFVVGAGNTYAPGATGGATSYTLSVANMPVHNHGIYDPGHTHSVADPGHAHSVYDGGHAHSIPGGGWGQAGQDNGGGSFISGANGYGQWPYGVNGTNAAGSNIGIYGAGTGIGIYGAATGVTINNAGSGAAFTVIPPYFALCYVMKISNN